MAHKHTSDEYLMRAKKLEANGKENAKIVKKLKRQARKTNI